MFKTNDISVGLQYRGHLSVGEERQRLGYAAFHWSVLIQSARALHQFDVTDGIVLDPRTKQDINKGEDWIYRRTIRDTTVDIARYLGRVKIGRLSKNCSIDEVQQLLEKLPLPVKGSQPQQNCVTWAVSAVRALQDAGIVQAFEISSLMDYALKFGDDRIAQFAETPEVIEYPPQKQNPGRTGPFSIFKRR